MKKILSILTAIALITVIGAAGVFGYSSFKELNNSKDSHKVETSKKQKESDDKNNTQQQEQNTSKENNNIQQQSNEDSLTENMDEEYKKQQEMYERQSKGEAPEPGSIIDNPPKNYETPEKDKITISELREVLGDDIDESKIDEAKASGEYINDEE
ncbi:hypothetical protein CPT_Madawaska_021 [Staphylococcus phage Madawaska]|nr:hypothetical protein CPT_Madawaska_021 [Staphylococcus phage Madawaska]